MTLQGLLLAAGAGSRMGLPKALVHDADGTSWLRRAVSALRDGGCDAVTVVLGAGAEQAAPLLDGSGADVVVADDWTGGMGASLQAGLAAVGGTDAPVVMLTLVDLPDVTAEVVRRIAALGTDSDLLARAAYDGEPGHPVLLGRHHWDGVSATAIGDRGARDYLATHDVVLVECADLATGQDVDHPSDQPPTRP